MSGNAQKTAFAQTINRFADRRARDVIQQTGQALPCSVVSVSYPFVTIKFEVASVFTLPQVTVPIFGPEYVRYPIQVGCKGVAFPASAHIGGVSGQGAGAADLSQPANLSALVFFPIGNTSFPASAEPEKLVLYGPDGVVIRNAASTAKLTISASGAVIDLPPGMALTINGNVIATGDLTAANLNLSGTINGHGGGTYASDLKTAGNVIAGYGGPDQVGVQTHLHHGVQTGGGSTSAPTAGT